MRYKTSSGLITRSRRRLAKDGRDKVYAFLGIACQLDREVIKTRLRNLQR